MGKRLEEDSYGKVVHDHSFTVLYIFTVECVELFGHKEIVCQIFIFDDCTLPTGSEPKQLMIKYPWWQ